MGTLARLFRVARMRVSDPSCGAGDSAKGGERVRGLLQEKHGRMRGQPEGCQTHGEDLTGGMLAIAGGQQTSWLSMV